LTLLALGGCAGTAPPGTGPDAAAAGAGRAVAQPSKPAPAADQAARAQGTPSPDPSPAPAQGATPTPVAAPTVTRRPARMPVPPAETAESLPDVELTPQILFQLLASEVAAQRGQVGSATATYITLARQTRDPRLARRATELALAERSLERALQAAQLWREFAPESALAAQTLEALWLSTGRLDAAEPLLAQRLAAARAADRLPQAYQELLRSLMRAPDRSAALATFDRLAAQDQSVPEARLAAAVLAERASDKERAAAESAAALRLDPDDETTAVTAARYAQQAAGAPAAAAVLEAFLGRQPKAIEARYAYARLLAGQGRTEEARKQMELALAQEPGSPAILYSLAQIAYQARQLDVAEDYLRKYLALPDSVPRDRNQAWLFLSQIEEDRGRKEQAIEWLAKVTSGEQFLSARIRQALLTARLGRIDEARELLRSTSVTSSRERSQLVGAEAQLLREARRYAEAFEVIDRALQDTPDAADLLYDHAMAAERIDRLAVMESSLRRLIELRPDNAHAYNALGYTYADRGIRLEEAQALIEKALELSPEDPHIIDSLGWVLYRRGKLDEALAQLRRAWEIRPEAEIGVHLGEVLWRMGRTDEARRIWVESRKLEPDNETLKQTLARLDVSL
ncbi:MAG TPA: tetratricopeptide repeat protein, partial [Quisquiliibacterium sp.]|nr:tetratricopeptide repeat protein [Quisquiliibacterium sp.]